MNAPFTLPDEQLEHLAEQYLALPTLRKHGISFETFLAATPQVRALGLLPLIALRVKLEQRDPTVLAEASRQHERALQALERDGASCANGRVVEKLKHHRHPRSRAGFYATES